MSAYRELVWRDDVIDAVRGEREHLIVRGQLGAEHVLAKHADAIIDSIPAVDAVEVRHGKWNIGGMFDDFYVCSYCGFKHPITAAFNYCPNCGAKMDGE